MIFPSGVHWRCCRTLKNHQIWKINWQKIKKSLRRLAINPFFGWFYVPENLISGTRSATRERWYSFLLLKMISNSYFLKWKTDFVLQFEMLLEAIMVNLKINSNLPLCIVKGNGRWNYREMQSRHKIKAESTQCSKIGKFCSYKCVQASSCTQRVKW